MEPLNLYDVIDALEADDCAVSDAARQRIALLVAGYNIALVECGLCNSELTTEAVLAMIRTPG